MGGINLRSAQLSWLGVVAVNWWGRDPQPLISQTNGEAITIKLYKLSFIIIFLVYF